MRGTTDGVRLALDRLTGLRAHAGRLGLSPGTRVRTARAGGYLSVYRGRGMEFDEVRPYQAGDDVRDIDWRVTARSGRAHTKVYTDERERPVFLLLDLSPGMYFGTRGCLKAVRAAEAGVLLAWAAVANGDRVGALMMAGKRHAEVRPMGRHPGVLRLIRRLMEEHRAGLERPGIEAADLKAALDRLLATARPGSLVFLISDFRHLDDDGEKRLARLARHNDVTAVFVFDPLEAEPPPPGRYLLSDGHASALLDTSDAGVVERLRAAHATHRARVASACSRRGIHFLDLATDAPLVEALRRGLHARLPHHGALYEPAGRS
ncbi:MAG: DUF58 domain-containing protein [Gammaproteobacteria bacterium]|nr:DUF58 domain-containing protein [Gammaproteobacteria bacterium]